METSGINHIILSVSNLEQSRKFYGDLLGFEIKDLPEAGLFYFMVGGISLWFVTHAHTDPDYRFSEFRVGLDHLSFTAPSREALDTLADKLKAAGVETK